MPHVYDPADAFIVTRTLDAPRELVFKAWTEAERMKRWWGPAGMAVGIPKMNLTPGGIMLYSMTLPDGNVMWGKFIYREIKAPERLVFVDSFSDENAGVTRHPFAPNWPLETLSTIDLVDVGGKTLMTLTGVPINASELECKTFEEGRGSMQQGWSGTLEQLAQYLATV